MPSNPQIDAPQTLAGLFPPDSDESEEEGEPDACYEVQSMVLAGKKLQIRQFAYHSHNANRVWPGTFNLADYLMSRKASDGAGDDGDGDVDKEESFQHEWGRVLELGTATGLLAIRLAMSSTLHGGDETTEERGSARRTTTSCCTSIVTSDVDDQDALVYENVQYNYKLNGVMQPPPHVPHTWGTGWKASAETAGGIVDDTPFDTVIASDILLYVSAYGALVETMVELIPVESKTLFVMSWNRRMKESAEFFTRMQDAGFDCKHEGKCIYTFSRTTANNNEDSEYV